MNNINPQYTFDHSGNPVGVFLPIEEWNAITAALSFELPDWQKKMIDERLSMYKNNTADILDWDEVAAAFDKEDDEA